MQEIRMTETILLLLILGLTAQIGFSQTQPVNLEGYYLPKNLRFDVAADSKEFKDFQHFALVSTSAKNINGYVITKAVSFRILAPRLRGSEFSFKTNVIKGVSYSFAGLLKMTDFSESSQESDILWGVLFKHRRGKTIASVTLDFDYWVGD
jgi:hypothetical protein